MGLEIEEKLLRKYEETGHFGFFPCYTFGKCFATVYETEQLYQTGILMDITMEKNELKYTSEYCI